MSGVEPESLKLTSTNATCLVYSCKTFAQNKQGSEEFIHCNMSADTVDPGAQTLKKHQSQISGVFRWWPHR